MNIVAYDKKWIDWSDTAVLLLPAGRSGHLELGYALGTGKSTHVIMDDPERWDVMYGLLEGVWDSEEEFRKAISA